MCPKIELFVEIMQQRHLEVLFICQFHGIRPRSIKKKKKSCKGTLLEKLIQLATRTE